MVELKLERGRVILDFLFSNRCRLVWVLVFLLALMSWLPLVALAQEETPENKVQEEPNITHQKKALELELQRMQVELKLDEKQLEKIRKDVADDLVASAKKMNEFCPSDIASRDIYPALIDRDLANAVHEAARGFADDAKLSEYRADFKKVLAWKDKYARKNVLVFLDTFLQLEPQQLTRIEKALEDNWNPVWNIWAMGMSYDGYKACKPTIKWLQAEPSVKLDDVLTDVQKKIMAKLEALGGNYSRVIGLSEEAEVKLIREDLELFLERSIEALSAKHEFSQRDMARIEIGFKGAWNKVAELRAANKKAYEKTSSLWKMSGVMDSGFQQMRREILWQRTVSRILDGELCEQYEKQEVDRQQRRLEVGAVFGIHYLASKTPMKHRDLVTLYTRSTELIKKENFSEIYRCVFPMFEQPDEFFKEALCPETYSRVELILPKVRHWKRPEEEEPGNEPSEQ